MDNYNKLFMIIRKTDLLNYEEKTELHLYLIKLKEQLKKQKEVITILNNEIDLVIELIKQQPTGDDTWIISRLNGFEHILKEVSECK